MQFESHKHTRTPNSVNFSMCGFFLHSMLSVQLSILKFPYLSFSDLKVEVTAVPSYEEKEEQFKDQVVSFSCIIC